MRIEQISIENYRSFGNKNVITFPNIDKPIALIGHNNAGKSNLIDAVLLALGKKNAYSNCFSKNDFYNHKTENDIIIKAKISNAPFLLQADAFNKTKIIDNIKLSISYEDGYCETNHILCDENETQIRLPQSVSLAKNKLYTTEEKEAFKERRTEGILYFSKIKNKIPLYFIDPMNIQDELSPKKNNLLANIMQKVKESFENTPFEADCSYHQWINKTRKEVFDNFLKVVEKDVLRTKELDDLVNSIKKEIMHQLNLEEDNFSLKLSLPDYEIFYKNLDFLLKDNNHKDKPQLPITNFGRGFALLFTVALLKILAKDKEGGNIFIFEEPETFLHEHYQEYFYNVLCDLAKNNQVIYTTHSKKFIDLFNPKTIIKLENINYEKTDIIQNNIDFITYPRDYAKYISSVEPNIGNIIFADKVIIVEGAHDILTYKIIFSAKINFGINNIAIIAAFGKDSICNLVKICKMYHIDYFVIHDWDITNDNIDISEDPTKSTSYQQLSIVEKQQYTKNHKLFIEVGKDRIHQNKKRLEEVLGIPQHEKGCEAIYEKIKNKSLEDIYTEYPKLINDNLLKFLNISLTNFKNHSKKDEDFEFEEREE